MSDVSITDLIAQLQSNVDALEAAEREIQQAEDQANNLAGDLAQAKLITAELEAKVADLESVTVPTENEENAYDVAYALYGEHDTLGVEGTDPRRECFEAGWAAAIARIPVPVEPEEVTEGGTR